MSGGDILHVLPKIVHHVLLLIRWGLIPRRLQRGSLFRNAQPINFTLLKLC